MARFAIGIDLGTTHSALSYIDLEASQNEQPVQEVLSIPQLKGAGVIDERPLLPSFLYVPHADEFSAQDKTLPWNSNHPFIVGEFARTLGATTAIRLVSSAKSWLCHPGVDRRAAILPTDAPAEVNRISPLEASVRYLDHLRQSWKYKFPDAPLDQQLITLTVPASFDPAARELTAEAAKAAGIEQFTLLEEPQAAFYSWIATTKGHWRDQVKVGDVILVVDVGGGTTDLSLIAVTQEQGNLILQRIAVGDHILLGGDNMDLALAHFIRAKLVQSGTQLDFWQLQALTQGCRSAKEMLLSDNSLSAVPLVVPGRGSKLIGGSIRSELTREEVVQVLIDGFFPVVAANSRPVTKARAGLTTLGLPYAQDAGITRHIAAFLGKQINATHELPGFEGLTNASFLHPSAVLFNGGVFKAPVLVERILTMLNDWLSSEGAGPVRLLKGTDFDLSVARGAAYYGYVRQGQGVRIRGGTAQAYYIGVESAMPAVPGFEPPLQALCVAPFGMEEGTEAPIPAQEFGLVVGEPVIFRFFGSSVRRDDAVGAIVDHWVTQELNELQEIQLTLAAEGRYTGEIVPVRLHAKITEMGTLEVEAIPRQGAERWKVEFDARKAPVT